MQERLRLVLDERRACGGASHDLEESGARDTGGLSEDQCLGHQLPEPRDHQIDGELHDSGLLSVSDVVDRRADRAKHGLDAFECLGRAGHDEAQVPGADHGRIPAHRRTKVFDGFALSMRGDACGARRRYRAHVDQNRAGSGRIHDLAGDGLKGVVIGERREDDVDPSGQIGSRACEDRAPGSERLGPAGGAIVHHELEAGVQEALRNGRAHIAETDQPHGVVGGAHCPV